MNEIEKTVLTEEEKSLLFYEKERDEMFKYLFDYLDYNEVNTANVAVDNTEELEDNEYQWGLRKAVRSELFDFYFGSLYSKLVDFFEKQHPEFKYDFKHADLFDSNYKTFIYFAVGRSITNIIEKHIGQIPEYVNDADDHRWYYENDYPQADKHKGLRISVVDTVDNDRLRYYLFLTIEEVSWFIDEQLDNIFQVLEIVAEKFRTISNLKVRTQKDSLIIEKTFELKNAKDPQAPYTNKEALIDAIKELGFDQVDENELRRLKKIFITETYKRNHPKK